MRAALFALLVCLLTAPPAHAAVELGVQDDPLIVRLPTAFAGFGADRLLAPERVDAALDSLRVDTVRMNLTWARVAGDGPHDPLRLWLYDAAVERQRAAGRRVQLTLSGPAPKWATGDHREGAYKPSARRYAAFAGAVARHFRGRVARYAIWNEPNWWSLLRPRRANARIYRRLFLRGSAAVRAADPRAKVLIGELAPLGQPEAATPPLRFLRRLTCSDRRWRATRRCPRLVADGFAHHPYTLRWAPEYPGPGRDDVTMGSLRRLTGALDRLARRRALGTARGRSLPLYLTEWGYHARSARVREPLRSAYVRRGLRLAARIRRVREVVWYQLAGPPRAAHVHWDTGLLDARGRPRPVFHAVRGWSRRRARRPRPPIALPAAARSPAAPVPGARARDGGVMAADPAGGPAVAWSQNGRVRLAQGRFRRARTIARGAPEFGASPSRLAVGPRGDALVAWERNDHSIPAPPYAREEDCCYRLRVAVVSRRGRIRFVERASRRLRGVDELADAVAVGPRRQVAVAFNARRADRLRVALGTARGGLARAEVVPPMRGRAGQAVAIWFRGVQPRLLVLDYESRTVVELRRVGRGRWLRRGVGLGHADVVDAASTARGGAQAVVLRRGRSIYAATRRPGGRFRIRRLAGYYGFDQSTVDVSASGLAVVAGVGRRLDSVRVATTRVGHAFGRLRNVGAPGVPEPLGVAARGRTRIAVAWLAYARPGAAVKGFVARVARPLPRPRTMVRTRHDSLALASEAPVFAGGVPLVAFARRGRLATARMR